MNITFMIGNGFDVGVGMKSRFSDYFPKYISESKDKDDSLKGISNSISENEEKWSYFEKTLGEYTQEFSNSTARKLINQLKDFMSGFITYLKSEEATLSFDDKEMISKRITNAFMNFYSTDNLRPASSDDVSEIFRRHSGENHVYNFINFNYTYVLKNCIETIPESKMVRKNGRTDKIGEIIHVHGTVDLNPITGVNDSTQISNEELSKNERFLKIVVKPKNNDANRMKFDVNATSILENSTIICVYGMSLGETDKKWWTAILNWLKASSERQLIVFDYDESFSASVQMDWIEKEDSIIDILSKYASNNFNIEDFRQRIHIAVHKNIFQMNLRKDTVEATLEKEGEEAPLMQRLVMNIGIK